MLDVFELLIQTYPRYADSASREAVQAVIMTLTQLDGAKDRGRGVTEQILGRLANEVIRIAKCPKLFFRSVFSFWCSSLSSARMHRPTPSRYCVGVAVCIQSSFVIL